MSKLSINKFNTRDLISQSKSLNEGMRKEAQLARIALTQGMMPIISSPSAIEDFVMLANPEPMQAIYLKSKTMDDNAFVAGIVQLARNAGLKQEDIIETYDHESIAMALCNFVQTETLKLLSERNPQDFEAISQNLEWRLQKFMGDARFVKIPEGEIIAVVQQVKRDMEEAKKIVAIKSEENAKAR